MRAVKRARDAGNLLRYPLLSRQLSRMCVEEIGVAWRLLGAFSALLSAVE